MTTKITCWADGSGFDLVKLSQQGIDRFTVQYGLEVKSGLTYNQAAVQLGLALMHRAACDGTLKNRTPE